MPAKLLVELADGCVHSGETLGATLGISRAAVCKQIKKLNESGLAIECVKGAGYRWSRSVELLKADAITAKLSPQIKDAISGIEVFWSTPSTNSYCMELLKKQSVNKYVCLAEQQTAGRGRRGRFWISAPCASLCMSVVWQFTGGPESLDGLSLAVAVAVANSLRKEFSIDLVKLKWPNDIFVGGAKMGGILIEVVGEVGGVCSVVIGIGLNVSNMNLSANTINQPWIDMESVLGVNVSRNKLSASILSELIPMLEKESAEGFGVFYDNWRKYDALLGQAVIVQCGVNGYLEGIAAGISDSGEFLLNVDGVTRAFKSGEVTLRYA